ncbi:aryl hydrocarbon receptor 2 isoform X1 [Phyllopteryx taeniolatus]|uniref:aryl hydrocarbon receptor 2 isoform X1 n=1 Tax=Phyllopteryx taeniolatus TaxID=161469 RepID=UPI002AD3DD71|nr:aryl hydrocarbon receptor 2 isoform X1 [Phyllopteryx taeniolatus]
MLASTAIYAVRKRKKPLQKIPKLPPPEGDKSNPSKRHRDRLNSELDKLTSLLPFTEEVRARLDKLSVLRLGVGYLKVKSFFNATLKNRQNGSSWSSKQSPMLGGDVQNALISSTVTSQVASIDGVTFSEGDLLLQALNGFVFVVTTEGYVFYSSPTIQDFVGFQQSDVIHQSVFELIHTDDRALFRRQLDFAFNPHFSQQDGIAEGRSEQSSSEVSTNLITYDPKVIPPENSSFLERNFCCRFRCLLDNSSGFVALNFCGRLKFLHGQNQVSEVGTQVPPQLALFAIATPLQPPSILEIRTKTLIFQSKHKLDFTPMGIDTRGKVVLGYSEAELFTKGSGYNFIHAADMMYCADNHVRMMKTGESGFTVFRLLTKKGVWLWVQANARLVLKEGKPDFIVAQQRPLTNEEGEEHFRLHRLQQSFSFTTGEAPLYNLVPTVDMPDTCSPAKQRKLDNYSVSPNSLLGCMLNQNQSVYCKHNSANTLNSLNDTAFKDTHATVNVPGDIWQHLSPKPAVESMAKSEDTIQDMVETLQQILGDGDLIDTVDVTPDELKSWESTLLKVRTNSCGLSDDLNDIAMEDILLYVEEQLQKEGGLKLPDQLDTWVPTLNLQNQASVHPGIGQDLSCPQESHSQLLHSRGRMSEQPSAVLGMMKLTHIDLPQLSSSGLNVPVAELISSKQTLSVPSHLHNSQAHTGGPPTVFDPGLVDSYAEKQNLRSVLVSFKDNHLGVLSCKPPTQIPPNQMAQSMQNCLEQRAPNLTIDHHVQRWPEFSFKNTQWNSNHMDMQNVSNGPVITADPAASSCMHSHLVLPSQGRQNQRQSWQLDQPTEPQIISNGPMNVSRLTEFQANPGVVVNHNPALYSSMLRTPFNVEHGIEGGRIMASSSCMLKNTPLSVPVNEGHMSQTPSCQRLEHSSIHISSPSCSYQGDGGAISNSNMVPLSCQMPPTSVNLTNLPVQQPPYLNLSDQLNSHLVVGNGGMAFPHCVTGTLGPQRANGKQL